MINEPTGQLFRCLKTILALINYHNLFEWYALDWSVLEKLLAVTEDLKLLYSLRVSLSYRFSSSLQCFDNLIFRNFECFVNVRLSLECPQPGWFAQTVWRPRFAQVVSYPLPVLFPPSTLAPL